MTEIGSGGVYGVPMETRTPIGTTGLAVSPVCLGTNVFGWTADEQTSFAVLDAYVAAGGNFIDTANVYSAWVPGNTGGESEGIIGRWLADRGRPADLVIATKVGYPGGPSQPLGLSRDSILRGCEESLERLGVDTIDIFYAHRDDPETPLDETLATFADLVDAGTVSVIAASNYSSERFRESHRVSDAGGYPRFQMLQPHFNLMERDDYDDDLAAYCEREGIAVAPYFALARGFLTGKYRPDTAVPSTPRAGGIARDYLNPRGWRVLEVLDEVAQANAVRPGQVALAWLLAQPAVVSPIASATSTDQVAELAAAAQISLTPTQVADLAAAGAAD